ncbi:MAG TPA: cupin domain-containing protein [Polyangia bacterium]
MQDVTCLEVPTAFVLADLVERAKAGTLAWEPFRAGVFRHVLYDEGPEGAAAALLRYEPGARVPRHEHVGHEHILVLAGSQQDQRGHYGPGTMVVNPPGSSHEVFSPDGCLVLAIWQRRIRFVEPTV